MKSFVYLLTGVCILTQACCQSILLLHYHVNKAVIASRYCENKDKPEKRCAGSCHLHKKLKEAENNQKPLRAHLKETPAPAMFCQALIRLAFGYIRLTITWQSHYLASLPTAPSFELFHPPKSGVFLPG